MVKRNIVVFLLFFFLLGGVLLEQKYIDDSFINMKTEVLSLQQNIKEENLSNSKQKINSIKKYWDDREFVLSLFVDYKDIDQIGKQIKLIEAHLQNVDFELAFVECELLFHIVKTYYNTVGFDWQNII